MLQRIRDNSSGPLAYVIVGLITLVFAVWGIGSYFTPSANPVIASVGDIDITRYQLKQAYDQRYRRLRTMLGERFNPDMIDPQRLRRSILQNLIRTAVLDQYAISAGYRTTDKALLQALKTDPRFQVDGRFSVERYKTLLANAGMQPAAFEARLRRNMVSQQVRAGVVRSAFAAPPGVAHAYSLRHQKRKVAFLLFPAAAYKDQVEIESGEIRAWYESHASQYMRPERVKLAYVELNRSALEPPEKTITRQTLRSLYADRKARFTTPDQRDARRIFVPVTGDNAAAARQKIQAIAGKLAQGKSFDDIAAATGADVKVAKLENVTRTELPADVAKALFNLEVGQVSSPVRAEDGWYLIKPTAVHPGQTKPFDAPEVQQQLKKMARRQWREQRFGKMSDRLEALAFQAPNSLDVVSSELGLEVQTTGWITRQKGEQLGAYEAVREAAFSDAVLKDRLNSTVIRIGEGRRVVVRVVKHQPPRQIPLAQVKDDIRQQLVAHKAQKLARQAARTARDKLSGGATLAQIAEATPAELKQPGYIGRSASDVPAPVRTAAFALPKPGQGGASYRIAQTAEGNAALVALRDVKIPQPGKADIPQRFVQGQRRYIAQLAYNAFVDYLRAHADVELNREQLNFK